MTATPQQIIDAVCTVYAVEPWEITNKREPGAKARITGTMARFTAAVLMLETGMTLRAVADQLNRTPDWVRKCARGHDIGSRGRETREILNKRHNNCCNAEINR